MKRTPTFVEGLDEVLQGGIPSGSLVLVTGSPGTMKTSLAFSVLHQNAVRGERSLYVTLEQSRDSLLAQAGSMGLDVDETAENLSVLDLAGLRRKFGNQKEQDWPWVDLLKMYAKGLKTSFDYHLLALDSLDALEMLAGFTNVRRELFDLIHWFRGLDCTLLIVAESSRAPTGDGERAPSYARHKEEYLADGILHLRKARQGDFGVQRQLRVVKMRGTNHEMSYYALLYENGFQLRPLLA